MFSPKINDVCSIFKQVLVHQMVSCDIKWRFFSSFLQYLYFLRHTPWVAAKDGFDRMLVSSIFPFFTYCSHFGLVHLLVCFFAFLLNFYYFFLFLLKFKTLNLNPQVIHLVIQTFNRLAV